jgi:hypothetical protein
MPSEPPPPLRICVCASRSATNPASRIGTLVKALKCMVAEGADDGGYLGMALLHQGRRDASVCATNAGQQGKSDSPLCAHAGGTVQQNTSP